MENVFAAGCEDASTGMECEPERASRRQLQKPR